jgi:hypothetical protein
MLLRNHHGREHDEIPWRTNMLQDCLACRWGVSIVISNPDYFYCLLTRSTSATRAL